MDYKKLVDNCFNPFSVSFRPSLYEDIGAMWSGKKDKLRFVEKVRWSFPNGNIYLHPDAIVILMASGDVLLVGSDRIKLTRKQLIDLFDQCDIHYSETLYWLRCDDKTIMRTFFPEGLIK